MKKFFAITFAVLAMAFSGLVSAQQLKIGTGAKGGTNDTVTNQMIAMCANDGSVVNVQQPGGSPANISDILANKLGGGLVQFDVMWLRSRNQDLSTIKVLMPMHQEQVHLITLAKDVKVGGVFGIGADKIVLNDVRNLKGLTVAAQGGSLYTAQAINQLTGLGYIIQSDYKDPAAALAAVREGKAAAAFIVGGAPVEAVSKLDRSFRILPFDPQTIEKLRDVYRTRTVNYENLSTSGIPTVETDALLVVNNYEGNKMKTLLNNLRNCVNENLVDLREAEGSHPAWRAVGKTAGERPRWAVYGN